MAVKNYVAKSFTADTTARSVDVNVKHVWFLMNDGNVDVTFNFDETVTGDDAFVLKAGEKLENFPVSVGKIFYKAASSTAAVRFIGLKRDIC